MSGEDIIEELKAIKGLIDSGKPKEAKLKINYLIDDIFKIKLCRTIFLFVKKFLSIFITSIWITINKSFLCK